MNKHFAVVVLIIHDFLISVVVLLVKGGDTTINHNHASYRRESVS